jgi:hypothetical protein
MVEISKSGSGEGPAWATGRGYSTGRRFCRECAPKQRRESVRRAGAVYRIAPRSRRLQATRQARYRERRATKFSAQKVTHQSVTEAPAQASASVALEKVSGGKDRDDSSNRSAHCSFCGSPLPVWAQRWSQPRNVRGRAPRPPHPA